MNLLGAAAMMVAVGTAGWAGTPSWTARACLDRGADAAILGRAEGTASLLLSRVDVKLVWAAHPSACANGAGLLVTVSRQTANTEHPGALAYALPYERTHIVLFL